MLDFELCIPTKIYFGRGQCARVGEISASRGYRRVLICYGGGSVVRTGLLERVKSSLDAAGVEHDEFGGIQANPTSERCAELAHYARERGSELLLRHAGLDARLDDGAPHLVLRLVGFPCLTEFRVLQQLVKMSGVVVFLFSHEQHLFHVADNPCDTVSPSRSPAAEFSASSS